MCSAGPLLEILVSTSAVPIIWQGRSNRSYALVLWCTYLCPSSNLAIKGRVFGSVRSRRVTKQWVAVIDVMTGVTSGVWGSNLPLLQNKMALSGLRGRPNLFPGQGMRQYSKKLTNTVSSIKHCRSLYICYIHAFFSSGSQDCVTKLTVGQLENAY